MRPGGVSVQIVKPERKHITMKSMGIKLTVELAYAIGCDAANAQKRKAHRTKWNVDDWNEACEVTNRLLDLLAHQEEMAGVPENEMSYQ